MSSAIVFLADGFEEVEALTVVDLLRRADIEVSTVSISGSLRVTGRSRIEVAADMLYEDAKPELADLLVLPGGMPGTTHLMLHKGLCADLVKAHDEKRIIAAICAAPTVFGRLGLLDGKRACCYPGMEDRLGGAEAVTDEEVVVDGGIITSRGAGTAIPFSLKLIEALKDESAALEIKKSIVYRD